MVRVSVRPPKVKRIYNFQGGYNSQTANEALRDDVSPYLRNTRYKSRESQAKRLGAGRYSDAIGQAISTSQSGVTATNQVLSTSVKLAAKFVAALSQPLVKLDVQVRNVASGSGPLMVELWSDLAGSPGTMIAQSSIKSGLITTSYQYLSAHFLSAPTLASGSSYWIVCYTQADGLNSYQWAASTGTTSKTAGISGSYSNLGVDLTFKTYNAPANPNLGDTRFYQSNGNKVTLVTNSTGVYTVNDVTGALTLLWAGTTTAVRYVFEQVNDTLYWVNSVDAPQQYNGTTVQPVPGSPGIASYVKLHKNTLFFIMAADPTRIVYSQPGDYSTYTSVSFLYVPAPKTPDPVLALSSLQDNLVCWTRQTKYILYGSDITNFTLRRSNALQGLVSADAFVLHENSAFFVSDNGIYSFNGATDTLLSEPIQPDFDGLIDKTKLSAAKSGNYLRVFWPVNGSAYNNMSWVYDLKFGIFFVDNNQYFNKSCLLKGSGDAETLVLGSSIVGQAFYADVDYSDVGTAIAFDYRTQYESFDAPEAKKINRRFFPEFTGQQGNYACDIYVDYNMSNAPGLLASVNLQKKGPIWGAFNWGATNWGASGNIKPELELEGEFYNRQLRYINNGVDQPIELIGQTEYYMIQRAL